MTQLRWLTLGLASFLLLTSCDIYKSSDRKKFEENKYAVASKLQKISFTSCSNKSLSVVATTSVDLGSYSQTEDSEFYILRQHLIHNQWIYETDNTNGVFCVYE